MAQPAASAAAQTARQTRSVAALSAVALGSSALAMWLTTKRSKSDPVFSFWREYQTTASEQLDSARQMKASIDDRAKSLWLERGFLKFTGHMPSASASVLRVAGVGKPEDIEAQVKHPRGADLSSARSVYTSEVYVTMIGHFVGGLYGYRSQFLHSKLLMRPGMCGIFVGAISGIIARLTVPEMILAGTVGRDNAVHAQQDFVRFLLKDHEAEVRRVKELREQQRS